jgi:cytochrome P450
MGVPAGDFAQLKQWCGYRAALAWGRPAPEDQVEIATSMAAYRKYLRDLVDAKIRAPADDLTSDLIAIHREAPDRLTLDEIASILFSPVVRRPRDHHRPHRQHRAPPARGPGRWTEIVARPDLIPGAVERDPPLRPSVPVWRRVTTRPVTLAGVDLPAGARLFLWLAAAGRDEEAFDRPAEFDMGRTDADHHLAFGRACTTAWAPTSASSKPRSRWPNSPPLPRPPASSGAAAHLPPQPSLTSSPLPHYLPPPHPSHFSPPSFFLIF